MKKSYLIPLVIITMILASCSTQYMLATNFHETLRKGMTKNQFNKAWSQPTRQVLNGNLQVSSRNFELNGDQWEILIYNVYEYGSVKSNYPRVDHKEYAAFRNGLLEEWGVGTIPMTLQGNPEVIHVESGK